MGLVVVGLSHATAPIAVRERAAYRSADVVPVLAALTEKAPLAEAVLLSTCNRTEFYLVEGDGDGVAPIWRLLTERLGEPAQSHGYVRRDRDAVTHLFRVASGLDSMILGEAQIHGQVRDAWEVSRPTSGAMLSRLFQTALLAASRVREETGVGRGAASVSSAAVHLAKRIFGSLVGRRAMILGAGDVAELALECLMSEGVRATLVANRTYERADEVARRHGATAVGYEACWAELHAVDLLLCSTASPVSVVGPEQLRPGLAQRGDRPLCILDLALPRDVEPAVRDLDNVFLYDLDDLRAAVAATIEQREDDVPAAEAIIAGEVERYWQWVAGLAAVPVVTAFREAMDRVREAELAQIRRRLGALTPAQSDALEHFSRSLMNKFMHEPSVRLRAAAANGEGLGIVHAARYLFGLDPAIGPKVDHDAESDA